MKISLDFSHDLMSLMMSGQPIIIADNELHRFEIESIVKKISYDVSRFIGQDEINFTTEECNDFSEELVPQVMEEKHVKFLEDLKSGFF